MKLTLESISLGLAGTVFFRNALNGDVMFHFTNFVQIAKSSDDVIEKTDAYSAFVGALYAHGGDFGKYLSQLLECDDNVYVRSLAAGKPVTDAMKVCFLKELAFFSSLTALSSSDLKVCAGIGTNAADFDNTLVDFTVTIPAHLENAAKFGYGIYAKYGMFRVDERGALVPVASPDPITLDDLIGYADERKEVIDNTMALLCGKPAANVLLCGDAGTGKSSTVKAVVNRFRSEGLRLIELRKDQLSLLPEVMGEIAENPLKFIIFVDDLSFACDDDGFGALKAALEGSASAKAVNAVIYATSNRRHLVKETFSSREGDEIHRHDSIEELNSLSARFGLTVLFSKPSKVLYMQIVSSLASLYDIGISEEELSIKAEAFALAKGGRSPRVAEQFIASLRRS